MNKIISVILCLLLIAIFSSFSYAAEKPTDNSTVPPAKLPITPPRVLLETSLGNMIIELNPTAAPKTVENFLSYVNEGFYSNTIFHRVIKGFMIQGGGFTENMQQKTPKESIINEADNGLKNRKGTIAMARTNAPHSASSQFFINTVDNEFLDFKSKTGRGWGYCVFGKVVEGMDVVSVIEQQPTTVNNGYRDVPVTPIIIKKAALINDTTTAAAAEVKKIEAKPEKK
jgi:peptidyl-prolyl cis-trans isomerase B (cyclophilin B)